MKDKQLDFYIEHIKNINKSEVTQNKLIDINNIVYPINDNKVTYYNKSLFSETETSKSTFIKRIIKTPLTKYYKYDYHQNAIINKKPFLDESILGNYSCKMKEILNNLKNSKGLSIIYSRHVWSGVIPIALMLEQNGYMRYTVEGEEQLLTNEYKSSNYRCYNCDKYNKDKIHTDKKHKDYHEFKIAKYILQTTSTPDIIKDSLVNSINKFSSVDNLYGENVKIFIGTDIIKEGIDFKNIRQLFLMDTWYNKSAYEQLIGRALRFCSHIQLKPEERNVTIYNLCSSLRESKDKVYKYIETEDEKRYRISENNDIKNQMVLTVLKQTAIDCLNNRI